MSLSPKQRAEQSRVRGLIIDVIKYNCGATVEDIKKQTNIHPRRVAGYVSRMVRAGMIVGEECGKDAYNNRIKRYSIATAEDAQNQDAPSPARGGMWAQLVG